MKLREQITKAYDSCIYRNERIDKILSLPIPNWIVEEKCGRCENGYITYNPNLNPNQFIGVASKRCKTCNGTGIITRPTLLSDLEREDVRLRRQ